MKMDYSDISRRALEEAGYACDSLVKCKVPVEKCTCKGGPAACRYHCAEYYSLLRTDYDTGKVAKYLNVKYGIDPVYRNALGKTIGNRGVVAGILGVSREISESEFKNVLVTIAVTLDDLCDRFAGFNFPEGLIIVGAEPSSRDDYGLSLEDSIQTDQPIMMLRPDISGALHQSRIFGHNDERLRYDIARHEIGHVLGTPDVLKAFFGVELEMVKRYGFDGYMKYLRENVSRYAANRDSTETISELFSKCTSHDYKRGQLEKCIENFVFGKMLNSGGKQ